MTVEVGGLCVSSGTGIGQYGPHLHRERDHTVSPESLNVNHCPPHPLSACICAIKCHLIHFLQLRKVRL